ncbi:flagellar protein G [Thermococcus sp. 21S9]|uniref:flagellar protein G n=1 Tax=Thermococcus sp. 21S9 TaxID=1638223 RepID=UPI001439B5EC|nr:flagellar protein G [Thermococcus sp. 21S9]NJE53912.1 flagellar protein G [Thermococcus sp. 21S9]
MAAGGPASELIMFIVAILVAGSVAGALAYVTNDIAQGISDNGAMLANKLRTDFAIINDPNNIPHSNLSKTPVNYTFYIKNIGDTVIPFTSNAVQVMINGVLIPPSNLTFLDPYATTEITKLPPYAVGAINVTLGTPLTSNDTYTLTVVLENGKKRTFIFKAP